MFRDERVNIKSAREMNRRGLPDSSQAAFAFREKRFLLTRNGKDFWPEAELPLQQTHGLIVLDADPHDLERYLLTVGHIISFVPFADYHVGSKLRFSPDALQIKYLSDAGAIQVSRYRLDGEEPLEWIDDQP
ncbi:DUF5615 family PIN-like protein [Cryptosporangium sp. NPDC048952]|uniref:DUF5615 family PIN-like protein n=1 Tax=Cryptosporangium sp. NPDC048952 TaxID=3363961 RepID=UPI003719F2D8